MTYFNTSSLDAVKLLLDAGFDPNLVINDCSKHTIIMKALLGGVAVDKIRYLVERGANVKFNTSEGNALHFAIKGGNLGNYII